MRSKLLRFIMVQELFWTEVRCTISLHDLRWIFVLLKFAWSIHTQYSICQAYSWANKSSKCTKCTKRSSNIQETSSISMLAINFIKLCLKIMISMQFNLAGECQPQELTTIGNRLLDWFSVIMTDTKKQKRRIAKSEGKKPNFFVEIPFFHPILSKKHRKTLILFLRHIYGKICMYFHCSPFSSCMQSWSQMDVWPPRYQ